MATKNTEPVYFIDGCIIKENYIYIASKIKSIDHNEYDHSRLFFLYDKQWFHHDLNWDIVSVCLKLANKNEPRKYCALSSQGEIEFQHPDNIDIENISDAGTFNGLGAVKQIKQIGDHLYVCGDQGQVYKREAPNQWVHFDKGILNRKISASATDLNSIDGIDEENIYTVGFNGKIFFLSGEKWQELDSPTNMHLERVKCVSKNEVYICGNNGTLLLGNKNGFKDISDTYVSDNFWGIEYFQGKIYLSSLNGLFVLDDKGIVQIKTGLEPEIKGYRLHANDGVLWSFGVDDLAFFDGKNWQRVIHPDNI